MVNVKIRVRPLQAYHYPFKVDELQIDSYERLESIQERYATTGSTTRLYHGQHELPLNTSIGSHNFDDYTILECCRSPAIAAALSACLKDIDMIKKIPPQDRNREKLLRILQTPFHIQNDESHEIWQSNSWNDDKLKSRIINYAIIKAVIQRQDRYHVHDLPQCNDCQSLFDSLEKFHVWRGGESNSGKKFQQQAHIFKPHKKDGSGPSTNWILLDEKLHIQQRIHNEFFRGLSCEAGQESASEDYLEEFVRRDHSRHHSTRQRSSKRSRGGGNSANVMDESNNNDDSDLYLAHIGSPNKSWRPQQRQSLGGDENSASTSLVASPGRTSQPKKYIPQYASGPFAVLATLHLAMHAKHRHSNGKRMLTLTEEQLKRLAQPRCRANLYDKGRIRGRNAFACMDGLIEKQLVRKEIIRNTEIGGGEIEKWGLLNQGEVLGGFCAEFDRAVDHVIPARGLKETISSKRIALCIDTREDAHFIQRMKWSCNDENVPVVEKELPAGDYLFLDQNGLHENILPIVIERKTWSDLADSCLSKGRARNRLDCVKLGSGSFCQGNCQLCKMKRCGCSQILFIIEGERCNGNDSAHKSAKKCKPENPCSACKQLMERYNVTQAELEGVLSRLQIEHGCFIQYTRSYNETVQSLFTMRSLLQSHPCFAAKTSARSNSMFGETIPYESYASNARSRSSSNDMHSQHQSSNVHEWDVEPLSTIIASSEWTLNLVDELFGTEQTHSASNEAGDRKQAPSSSKPSKTCREIILLDSESGKGDGCEDGVTEVPRVSGEQCVKSPNPATFSRPIKRRKRSNETEVICLDSESENGGESSDDDVIEVEQEKCTTNHRKKPYDDANLNNITEDYCVYVSKNSIVRNSPSRENGDKVTNISRQQVSDDRNCSLFLILHGWDKYDQGVQKHLERIWTESYSSPGVLSNEFYNNSVKSLDGIVHASMFPMVRRRTLISFTLWLQLIVGIQVRSVQRTEFAAEIKMNFEQQSLAKTPSSSHANNTSRSLLKTPIQASIGRAASDETSYVSPLQSSVRSSQNVSTPVGAKRKLSLNSESESIREARLRRFETPTSSRPSAYNISSVGVLIHQSNEWSCTKCTFLNADTKDTCSVCDSIRIWSCSFCTSENPFNRLRCVQCNTLKKEKPPTGRANMPPDVNISSAALDQMSFGVEPAALIPTKSRDIKASSFWSCSFCMSENPFDNLRCFQCDTLNKVKSHTDQTSVSPVAGILSPAALNQTPSRVEYAVPTPTKSNDVEASSFWSCSFCMSENTFDNPLCFQCDTFNKGKTDQTSVSPVAGILSPAALNQTPSRVESAASMPTKSRDIEASSFWSCSFCMSENTFDNPRCFQCDTFNKGKTDQKSVSPVAGILSPAALNQTPSRVESAASMPTKRCGACGLGGHNRSNATDDNCPAYFDEKEIKRREDQKRKKELAILREEQRIARLEQDEKNAERLRADFLRQAEELNQAVARTGELRKEEIKKSKQKVQRMQKRQNLT